MIFKIENGKPKITPEALFSIDLFKQIWERDNSPNKETASIEFAYIYHAIDHRSIFANVPLVQKNEVITRNLSPNKPLVIDNLILEAMSVYRSLTQTPIHRLYEGAVIASDKTAEYFTNVDYRAVDVNGRPLYNVRDVSAALEKVGKIRASLVDLLAEINKQDENNKSEIRGKVVPNIFDKGIARIND